MCFNFLLRLQLYSAVEKLQCSSIVFPALCCCVGESLPGNDVGIKLILYGINNPFLYTVPVWIHYIFLYIKLNFLFEFFKMVQVISSQCFFFFFPTINNCRYLCPFYQIVQLVWMYRGNLQNINGHCITPPEPCSALLS